MPKNKAKGALLLLVSALVLAAAFEVVNIDAPYEPNAEGPNLEQVWHATGGFTLSASIGKIVLARFSNPDGSATYALYKKISHFSIAAGWKRISAAVNVAAGEDVPDIKPNQALLNPDEYQLNAAGEMLFAMDGGSQTLEILVPGTYGGDGPVLGGTPSIGESGNYCGPGTDYDCVYF